MEDLSFYRKNWEETLASHKPDPKIISHVFQELVKAYSSKKRYYHNLTHVADLLRLLGKNKKLIRNPEALTLAIWFHDAVYEPTASDNEEKSAALAARELKKLNIPAQQTKTVTDLILKTKNHTDIPDNTDQDTRFFLDFDLKILGTDRKKYEQYLQQIRQEYKIIPDLLYKPGRRKALKKFLETDHIYKTLEFRECYEQKARMNITWELSSY